jgi:hypothetical protein
VFSREGRGASYAIEGEKVFTFIYFIYFIFVYLLFEKAGGCPVL